MAISATFTANFSSFYDAVDKAEVKLADFAGGAEKAGDKLNKMAQSFSGQKIVQEATLMVKAIDGVEGITKLTEKEMARLGATTNEAVAKLKALGKDVPKDLQAVADATRNANKQTIDWMGSLGGLAGAIGIAFSVGAVKDFVGSIFDAASAVQDLSDQWGISTDAVQEFVGAAKLSGVESEKVGKSIQFLTTQLQDNSAQYQALLKNVGLTGDALKKMPVEDAYREVLRAIEGIKDESLQLDAALALLGPSAKQLIGAIRDGMLDATKDVDKMSKETIKRLADAEDAWGRLKDKVVIVSGEMLAAVMTNLDTMTSSWSTFFGFLAAELKNPGMGGGMFLAQAKAADTAGKSLQDLMGPMTRTTAGTTALGGAMKTAAQITEELAAKEKAEKAALDARAKALADAKAKQDAYNKAVQAQADKIKALAAALNGADLVDKANAYLEALEDTIPIAKMTAQKQAEINKAMADAIDVYVRAGTVIPRAMLDVWVQTKIASDRVVDFNFSLEELKKRYLDLTQLPKFDPFKVTGNKNVELPNAPKEFTPSEQFRNLLLDVTNVTAALGNLGTVVHGPMGDVLTAVGDIGHALQTATVQADLMKKGLDQIGEGKTVKGLTNIGTAAVNLAGQFMAVTDGAGILQSAISGAAMGSAFGLFGAGLGTIIGVWRGFENMNAANDQLETLRDTMLDASVGFFDGTKYAKEFQAVLDAKNVRDLQAAWRNLTDEIQGQELRDAYIDAAGGIDQLALAAQRAGFDITNLMKFSGEPLTNEINKLTLALQQQATDMALLQATAEKYGFTIEQLGPAMQAQELDKISQGLFKDWQVLNAAGLETVDITDKMGDSVSDYVNKAKKLGFEVPAAMKPMLQAMVDSGDLIDENGDAITDLEKSGVKFSMTMSQGFDKLIKEVERLATSIRLSLGLAIENTPDIEVEGRVTWKNTTPPGPGGNQSTTPAPTEGSQYPEYAKGTGGFRNFGTGTPAMLHGWEAVVPRDDAASFATVAASAGSSPVAQGGITVVLEQDGKKSAQWIAPYLAGEVYRLRLA